MKEFKLDQKRYKKFITALISIYTAKSMCNNYIPLFIKYSGSKNFKLGLEKVSKENEKQMDQVIKILACVEQDIVLIKSQSMKKIVDEKFKNFIYKDGHIDFNNMAALFFLGNIENILFESMADFKDLTKRLNYYHKDNVNKIIDSLKKNIDRIKKTTQIIIDRRYTKLHARL